MLHLQVVDSVFARQEERGTLHKLWAVNFHSNIEKFDLRVLRPLIFSFALYCLWLTRRLYLTLTDFLFSIAMPLLSLTRTMTLWTESFGKPVSLQCSLNLPVFLKDSLLSVLTSHWTLTKRYFRLACRQIYIF